MDRICEQGGFAYRIVNAGRERDADTLSQRFMVFQWTTKRKRAGNFLFGGNVLMDDVF